ncbi:MAG: hypothetical protein WCT53_00625, partial [Candidatus Gracilibacteria bacterium]
APTSSGSWDLTPPDQITGFSTGTTGNGNIPLLWSAITAPSDFQGFHVYYKTSAAVTYSNGTLWSSTNDTALRTATTTGTDVTDLTVGDLYYFIIHVIDKAGNFSTASSEISANAAAQGRAFVETTPPAIPTDIKVESKDGKAILTWADPTASDLALIEILRGKNEIPVSGDIYVSVNKEIKTFTDKDVKVGDTVKYILRSKDINGNRSGNSGTVTVTIPEATQIVTGIQNQQIQNQLPTKEEKLTEDGIALLEKSIATMDKVLGLYNVQIKKLSINKTKNKVKIAQIKSVMRRIEKNKAKQVIKLEELKKKLKSQN